MVRSLEEWAHELIGTEYSAEDLKWLPPDNETSVLIIEQNRI